MAVESGHVTVLADRYRVLRRLGAGGMAAVFLAHDERLGRRVAVKRLHADSPDDAARRFQREAKLGASLNHPNLVSIFDTVADEEGVLIVMEYVEGRTLAAALREGRMEPERATEVIAGVAAGLDHAHGQGVLHRDVKPANVLLGEGGQVKLADLGIATAAEATQITRSGAALGTPSYMAPEQLDGRPLTSAVDVYGLAAVAFETIGGRKARTGRTAVEIAHKAATEPPPDLREAWPGAPPAASEALKRGMAADPAARPATAGELVADLRRGLAKIERPTADTLPQRKPRDARPRPAGPAPSSRPTPSPVYSRASRRWLPFVALAAVALLIGAVVLASGGGDDGEQAVDRPAQERGEGSPAPPQQGGGEASPDQGAEPAPQADGGETDSSQPAQGADPAEGERLNGQGFQLMQQGRYEEAVPVLQRSVAAFPEGTDDIEYAFALYNLGRSLRLAGRPDEAIPILERRLQIPNQQATVRSELELARSQAGEE